MSEEELVEDVETYLLRCQHLHFHAHERVRQLYQATARLPPKKVRLLAQEKMGRDYLLVAIA